ncbi:MAG: hypothetical protein U5K76_08200 [Woeseiaceae bacterium]|nr:hypothetical protein [Woeseiaceae bacterium]
MDYCHRHNLVDPSRADRERSTAFVSRCRGLTRSGACWARNWERIRWYATESERDRAYADIAKRHGYYRRTDTPTQAPPEVRAGVCAVETDEARRSHVESVFSIVRGT